ncbi:hypothetical protein IIA79_05550 [bacterium]|nr:hypothetical protein [bacterium]
MAKFILQAEDNSKTSSSVKDYEDMPAIAGGITQMTTSPGWIICRKAASATKIRRLKSRRSGHAL